MVCSASRSIVWEWERSPGPRASRSRSSATCLRIAAGQHVPVRIKLAKGDRDSRKALIRYRYDNGPWEQEYMTGQDGQYVSTLDARLEQGKPNAKLEVRIEAGDDERRTWRPLPSSPGSS